MSEYVLQTSQLTKHFNKQVALHKVNLTVKKGSIYGFIGQNGAGKSTMIRIICGLAKQKSGSIELFGHSSEKHRNEMRKRIGTLIEGPALYPHMTAVENLEANRLLKGIPGQDCVGKVLQLVGLQETGKKKVKNYSLGMKQRLGIAIALLGDPEFLILDEPINGLDPMGVMEMRELLKRLNMEYGITILLSSHLLSELHLLATHYGMIHRGHLIEQLTAEELDTKCRQYLHIKVDNPEVAASIIETKLSTTNFDVMPDGVIKLFTGVETPGNISSALVQEGLIIEQFMPMGEDLESYFMKKIGGGIV